MVDINFLSSEKKERDEKGKSEPEREKVEWTLPKKEKHSKKRGSKKRRKALLRRGYGAQAKKKDKQKDYLEKNHLKESRREVLSEIKKESQTKGRDSKNSSGSFLNWTKNIKKKFGEIFGKDDHKSKKKIMVDYKEIFNEEKEKRQNGKKVDSINLAEEKESPPLAKEKPKEKVLSDEIKDAPMPLRGDDRGPDSHVGKKVDFPKDISPLNIKKESRTKPRSSKKLSESFLNWTKNIKKKFGEIFRKDDHKGKKKIMTDYKEIFNEEKESALLAKEELKEKILSDEIKDAPMPLRGDDRGPDSHVGKKVELKKDTPSPKKEHKKFFGEKFKFSRPKWEALRVIKTNLIEGEELAFANWKKNILVLGINIFSACLLVGIIYGGLIFWERQTNLEGEMISEEIEDLQNKIATAEEEMEEIDNFQDKLNQAATMLERHIYWTNFFKLLEENTLAEVYYTGGFSGDTNGKYNLSAIGKDYSSIEAQLKVLRQAEGVNSAEALSGSMAMNKALEEGDIGSVSGNVSFAIDLKINPSIFVK